MQRFLPLLAVMLLACPSGTSGDDDDSDRVIPPPSGCNLTALSTVVFQFHIHWAGEEYPQDELVDLLTGLGYESFVFPFGGVVTELGEDPDSNFLAVTLTEMAPEGEEPLKDPNWLRVVYQLPLGHELPVSLDQNAGVELNLQLAGEALISGFALYDLPEDADPELLFLAEPSDLGMAYEPGDSHPLFDSVQLVDRACPNLTETSCASVYNLLLSVRTKVDEETGTGGDLLEVWPTESVDFSIDGPSYTLVNAWSFTHREVQECNNGYDFSAERKSFFVIRSEFAP
jgi:hypothetical protein